MNWREATCEKCTFRVGNECRRFPPDSDMNYSYVMNYVTGKIKEYSPACSEYAETIQPLTIKEETR